MHDKTSGRFYVASPCFAGNPLRDTHLTQFTLISGSTKELGEKKKDVVNCYNPECNLTLILSSGFSMTMHCTANKVWVYAVSSRGVFAKPAIHGAVSVSLRLRQLEHQTWYSMLIVSTDTD